MNTVIIIIPKAQVAIICDRICKKGPLVHFRAFVFFGINRKRRRRALEWRFQNYDSAFRLLYTLNWEIFATNTIHVFVDCLQLQFFFHKDCCTRSKVSLVLRPLLPFSLAKMAVAEVGWIETPSTYLYRCRSSFVQQLIIASAVSCLLLMCLWWDSRIFLSRIFLPTTFDPISRSLLFANISQFGGYRVLGHSRISCLWKRGVNYVIIRLHIPISDDVIKLTKWRRFIVILPISLCWTVLKTRAHLLVLFSSISTDTFCLHTSKDSRGAIIQLCVYSVVLAYLRIEQNGVFTISGKLAVSDKHNVVKSPRFQGTFY